MWKNVSFNEKQLSELAKCDDGLGSPKATLTCSKAGKKDSCSLTCTSKAHYTAGRTAGFTDHFADRFFI